MRRTSGTAPAPSAALRTMVAAHRGTGTDGARMMRRGAVPLRVCTRPQRRTPRGRAGRGDERCRGATGRPGGRSAGLRASTSTERRVCARTRRDVRARRRSRTARRGGVHRDGPLAASVRTVMQLAVDDRLHATKAACPAPTETEASVVRVSSSHDHHHLHLDSPHHHRRQRRPHLHWPRRTTADGAQHGAAILARASAPCRPSPQHACFASTLAPVPTHALLRHHRPPPPPPRRRRRRRRWR